jgi:hypothetical protein
MAVFRRLALWLTRELEQTPIAPEILKIVSGRINTNDKGDHLLLPPESEEAMP